MKVGLDAFTVRNLNLSPLELLDFIKEKGYEGVQFEEVRSLSPTLDEGVLKEIADHARELGLYMHVSVSTLNPYNIQGDRQGYTDRLREEFEVCHQLGFKDLHSKLGSEQDRLHSTIPWAEQLRASIDYLKELAPILRDLGLRLSIEDHGDTTTFDLVKIVESVGDDVIGVCLDTANVLVNLEDPLEAAKRVAPYVTLTHAKDAIVYFSERGLERQVRPAGLGILPWADILEVLGKHNPDLTLSVEDHKEYPFTPGVQSYSLPIYDDQFLAHYPDLTPGELARLVQSACEVTRRIEAGEMEPPEAYAVPWEDRAEQRLRQSRDHLKSVLKQLGLLS